METLAVIPKVHFKESQNFRIKGSWMEVFIHSEPRRSGGNTRTFAGIPILNLAFLPPHNPSFFWQSRVHVPSYQPSWDGVELMGWRVGGTGMECPDTSRSKGTASPCKLEQGGAQCWDSKSRLNSWSCENSNTQLFSKGGRNQQLFGFWEPLKLFPKCLGFSPTVHTRFAPRHLSLNF